MADLADLIAAENAELRAKVAELEKAIASIGPAAAIMWFNEGVEAAIHAVHDYMLASYDADGNSDLRVAIEVIRALKRENGDG